MICYQVNYMKPKKKGYAKQTATFLKIEDAVFWEQHVEKNELTQWTYKSSSPLISQETIQFSVYINTNRGSQQLS